MMINLKTLEMAKKSQLDYFLCIYLTEETIK
jgi:hypothetical protein